MKRTALVLVGLFAACSSFAPEREDEEHERNPGGVRQRALARGPMPHDALMQALAHKDAMQMVDDFGPQVQWTWLGPGNVGGRLRAILIDPQNPQRIWVGSAGGGVWYSDTGGAAWAQRSSQLSMFGCGCMAMDPLNADHLFFGSGEGFFDAVEGSSNTAILRGAGLFETLDGGVTWTRLAATATPDWYFCNRLAIAPGNPLVMLAATGTGIWRTVDGGQTWSQRTTDRALDVDFHPTDPLRAVAGRSDGRTQWSTDGGVTWTSVQLSAAATRVELAYARSNPSTVYATVSDAPNWTINVWRSLDGGQTWGQRSTSGIATYSLYNNCLWVDPTNDQNLVLGGVQIYRSTNGGVSSAQFSTGAHPDYHVVVEDPGFNGTTNKRIYCGNDDGIFTRADWQTGSWIALNNGLGVTQFYGAAMNATGTTMIAGAQDNGTSRYTGNAASWNYNIIGGDGGFCAADQTNPSYFYGEYQYLGLQRSSNGGASWSDIRGATTSDPGFNFIPYFLLDPNDQNRMIACGRTLWRTNNVRTGAPPTWTPIKTPRFCPPLQGPAPAHFQDNPFCNHSAAQIAVGDSNLVWVGHNDGEVYRSNDALSAVPNWTLIDSAGGQLPDRWVSSIAIDPANHLRVILSFMGYTTANVWETLDGGTTWHAISGSGPGALPALPVSWVLMHPNLPDVLFAATDLGLFHSQDRGASWAPIGGGPENVCIDQLVWKNDRELLVVTHGRGIWVAALPLATAQSVGTGCAAATVPALSATPPALGSTVTFAMANARPSSLVIFGIQYGPPVSVPLGGCTVSIDVNVANVYVAGGTSSTGAWSHGIALPLWGSLVGAELAAQAMVLGASGPMFGVADLSQGVDLHLGL